MLSSVSDYLMNFLVTGTFVMLWHDHFDTALFYALNSFIGEVRGLSLYTHHIEFESFEFAIVSDVSCE